MGGLSFKRRNIDLRYFSQDPFDRVHIFPRDRGCGCNPPAQDLHRKVKKKKKQELSKMPRNAIRSQFYSTWLRPVLLSSFSLSLSLSLQVKVRI